MNYIVEAFLNAGHILFTWEHNFSQTVLVSVKCSAISVFFACSIGLPSGIMLALTPFPGKRIVISIINTLLAMPTVVIGLFFYTILSRKGILGSWGMLYSQQAIILGQIVLIIPLITGFTLSSIKSMDQRILPTISSLGASKVQCFLLFVHEARYSLYAAAVTGFGRVFSEVGVSMMLGGNIKNYTRTITTSIALETNKGEISQAIALGIVLIVLASIVNISVSYLQDKAHESV